MEAALRTVNDLLTGTNSDALDYNEVRGIDDGIKEACSWIAPVSSYPGELEHEAMRDGALRVLRGEETAKTYPGKPVFAGFDFD